VAGSEDEWLEKQIESEKTISALEQQIRQLKVTRSVSHESRRRASKPLVLAQQLMAFELSHMCVLVNSSLSSLNDLLANSVVTPSPDKLPACIIRMLYKDIY